MRCYVWSGTEGLLLVILQLQTSLTWRTTVAGIQVWRNLRHTEIVSDIASVFTRRRAAVCHTSRVVIQYDIEYYTRSGRRRRRAMGSCLCWGILPHDNRLRNNSVANSTDNKCQSNLAKATSHQWGNWNPQCPIKAYSTCSAEQGSPTHAKEKSVPCYQV